MEPELCERCGKNHAQEPHNCPYQSDVNNDDEFTCNCCDTCVQDCADDV